MHPASARRQRPARPGADRHRQDRRLRAADPLAPGRSPRRRSRRSCSRPPASSAIQVAEAFQRYATGLPGFRVLPIYGGQSYGPQLSALQRGVHVVVGTPGRIIDHLERGSLDLSSVRFLVLDEADEMLRMGFIDDVETILRKTPPTRQTALFSATLPGADPPHRPDLPAHPVEVTIAAQAPAPPTTSASATGSSTACTSSTRSPASSRPSPSTR
jgi:hypothetical protein